ncbi:TIGR03084 family protein [Gordonia sp. TBRC 11910]|uniref:TIGR03084 family protein n=1 Tax=Gordonia asplenii TaxID=2725283 RepID=A0A848KVW5_9ACTN|nr:TIGR03084 family metal-binding protein [Gordonia asplenii]NMO00593.1 TIGR03084 family protein [Gordonia asplenii]
MALDYARLLTELRVESQGLSAVLADLSDADWALPTPAAGWSITDQVSHLAFFDDAASSAITAPDDFRSAADELISGGMDFPDRIAERYRDTRPDALRRWFTDGRAQLLDTFAATDPKARVPWYGPDMSVASSATARLMETWAHGQDVYDTLNIEHPPTLALRSIAHLGVSTFGFTHRNNGLPVPDAPVRVELTAPDGDVWTWGPETADDVVTGAATDFVFVVTQRRHRDDTNLRVVGDVAMAWMTIAQAFAGAPSPGRARLTGGESGRTDTESGRRDTESVGGQR